MASIRSMHLAVARATARSLTSSISLASAGGVMALAMHANRAHRRNFSLSSRSDALSKFLMPAMSPTMTEGGIAAWKKQPGESFTAGDVLLEIETDKATMDVEAQDDGIMAKVVIDAGAKNVPVNSIIAIIGEEGDDLSGADALAAEAEKESASTSTKDESAKSSESESDKGDSKDDTAQDQKRSASIERNQPAKPTSAEEQSSKQPSSNVDKARVFASPLARKLAQDRGIPLSQVSGTGPNGRVIKADIENYKVAQPSASESKQDSAQIASSSASAPSSASNFTDTPTSSMRKVIASRLSESKQQVPHYYVSIDVEMDKVLRLRQLFNEAAERQSNGDATKAKEAKLSVGDFITKAAAVALKHVPDVNAAWHGDFIRQYHTADISIAVSTPTGLLTPIVKNVGNSGLATISATTKALATKARQGKLQPNEYQGGTFTISNMGMYGITHFTAIINLPQSAILAIGGTEPRIVVDESDEKGWRKAMVMQATISADHRIVDGATAARWMKSFKDALENPLTFML